MRRVARLLLAAAALAAATGARADDDKKSPPDQGGYDLFHPTPDDKLRALCVDRPNKGTSACTVDPGRWQVEVDVADGTFERSHGVATGTGLFAAPNVKLGLTPDLDVEANLPLAEIVRTHDRSAGTDRTVSGVGDLMLKLKYAAVGNGGSDFALALEPYLLLPTARHAIGEGAVEGGLLVPISANLPAGWSLNLTPEVDVLPDQQGDGRHVQLINLVGLSHPLPGGFTGAAELWSALDMDPSGDTTQLSFDVGLAWTPKSRPDIQLDGGVNLGLNRDTPGAQVYAGISKRF